MHLADLIHTAPTVSTNVSLGYLNEMFENEQWCLYSTLTNDELDLEAICRQFLAVQALVPGFSRELIPGAIPIDIFLVNVGIPQSSIRAIKGALFQNGAVLYVIHSNEEDNYFELLVSNDTAETWNIPGKPIQLPFVNHYHDQELPEEANATE